LDQRGEHPGLVHIFSAMEACSSYRPWHDKKTARCFLKPAQGKCLHYYFYFVDPEFGLCYMRVPTWGPFRLQVYFNGHNWLACRLQNEAVGFTMLDNAFSHIDDFERAQRLSDAFDVARLHERLLLTQESKHVWGHFQSGWIAAPIAFKSAVLTSMQCRFGNRRAGSAPPAPDRHRIHLPAAVTTN
jgi:hypothetical protein